MRKSWSKILAGALCFALAACNNDDIATVNDGECGKRSLYAL